MPAPVQNQAMALLGKLAAVRDFILSWLGYKETDKAVIPMISAAGKFLEMVFEIVGALFQTFAGRAFFGVLVLAGALLYGRFYFLQEGRVQQAAIDKVHTMATVRVYLQRAQAIEHRVCPDAPPLIKQVR